MSRNQDSQNFNKTRNSRSRQSWATGPKSKFRGERDTTSSSNDFQYASGRGLYGREGQYEQGNKFQKNLGDIRGQSRADWSKDSSYNSDSHSYGPQWNSSESDWHTNSRPNNPLYATHVYATRADYSDFDSGAYERQGRRWDDSQSYGRHSEMLSFAGKGPKGYRRSDDRIKEDVCDCLARDPRVDASEIEVEVKDCCVTLSGTIDSKENKRYTEMLVENLNGVEDVINEIRVQKNTPLWGSSEVNKTQSDLSVF